MFINQRELKMGLYFFTKNDFTIMSQTFVRFENISICFKIGFKELTFFFQIKQPCLYMLKFSFSGLGDSLICKVLALQT